MYRRHLMMGLLASLLGLLVFSGLGSAKEVVIEYWYGSWNVFDDAQVDIINRFNEAYKGRIKVNATLTASMDQKLTVATAGGVAPDVAQLDRFLVGGIASQGIITTLDDLIKRDGMQASSHWPATWGESIYNGKVYAIATDTDVRALVYNKTLFAQSGLDPNRPPFTWEQADQYANKLDRAGADGSWQQVGFVPHQGSWHFYGWLLTAGGQLLDKTNRKIAWNSAEGLRALDWMQERLNHYGGNAKLGGFDMLKGNVAMLMTGSGYDTDVAKAGLDKTYEIAFSQAPRPAGLEKDPASWSGGWSLVVPQGIKGEQREAAWEFIKFCLSHDVQVQMGVKSGRVPSLISAARDAAFLKRSPYTTAFVKLMPYTSFRPVIPAGGGIYPYYTAKVRDMMLKGDQSPRQILEESARVAQQILDEGWQRADSK